MLSLMDFGILAFHHFMGAGHAVYHTGFHIAVQRYLIGEFRAVSKTSVLCILSKKLSFGNNELVWLAAGCHATHSRLFRKSMPRS